MRRLLVYGLLLRINGASTYVDHEMEGQSASTSLVTEHQCPRVVRNEKLQRAAQGNPRIEGVSCAAYLFYNMNMRSSEGDFNDKQQHSVRIQLSAGSTADLSESEAAGLETRARATERVRQGC